MRAVLRPLLVLPLLVGGCVVVHDNTTPPPGATVPGAPTNVVATAGNGSATVSWSPPAESSSTSTF